MHPHGVVPIQVSDQTTPPQLTPNTPSLSSTPPFPPDPPPAAAFPLPNPPPRGPGLVRLLRPVLARLPSRHHLRLWRHGERGDNDSHTPNYSWMAERYCPPLTPPYATLRHPTPPYATLRQPTPSYANLRHLTRPPPPLTPPQPLTPPPPHPQVPPPPTRASAEASPAAARRAAGRTSTCSREVWRRSSRRGPGETPSSGASGEGSVGSLSRRALG